MTTSPSDPPLNFPDYENRDYYFTIVNSKTRPKDFGDFEYDIHVYFNTLEERSKALALRNLMREIFAGKHVYLGELIDLPIGPHLEPMWEGNFSVDMMVEVVQWLMENRGDLKILIHKLSGYPLWDHTAGALFMGDKAPLNVSIFRK